MARPSDAHRRSARPPFPASRRRLRALAVVVAFVAVASVPVTRPAGAGGGPVERARARVQEAQDRLDAAHEALAATEDDVAAAEARATEAAQRLADAQAQHAELSRRILDVQAQIDLTQDAIDYLRPIAEARAVAAYEGADITPFGVFAVDDLMDAARGARLLGTAKAAEEDVLEELAVLQDDLDGQHAALADDRRALDETMESLAAAQDEILAELNGALEKQTAAQAEVAAATEELDAATDALAAARRAAAQAPPTTSAPAGDTDDDTGGGTPDDDDGGSGSGSSGIICPIEGPVAFVDTWGAWRPGGRTHEGVDIFSPADAPNVAVVSGRITQGIGDNQGFGVFLYGDDGNSYWYFHLSRFAGGPRRVQQGEVIGYTGDSGNARPGDYHTHFEYHPGHGGPVNPYPIVAAAC